ncbi:methyltransferase family protein [Prauserella shujinwangii]|uniref:Methyltransferase family protein n=2 Tax=Prauserella shujinwangii TaxID=1453103 RepID=A0A2T0LRY8_9PSEU|nr:methyltransferase family protein [Prauserella shujinwangii]
MDTPSANAEAEAAWNGEYGEFWAEHADRFDAFLAGFHPRFLAAAGIGPGERVLDIGCGNGQATLDAARLAGSGSALGVDLSAPMLAVARRRATDRGVGNAEFLRADAQVHPFPPAHADVAISRTGAMFFADPVAAFGNLARALRPGGRLVLLVWQDDERNEWMGGLTRTLCGDRPVPRPPADAPDARSLADPGRVRAVLTAAGFTDVAVDDLTAPVRLGDDPESARRFALGLGNVRSVLARLDENDQPAAHDRLRESIAAHTGPDGVRYAAAAWLVRARRR